MKYIIDRFEGKFAVCEDEEGNVKNIEIERIPNAAKEGDILYITDEGIELDIEATIKRKSKIEELVKTLWVD